MCTCKLNILLIYLLSNQLIDSVDETSNSSSIATTTTTPKNVQAAAEMNWVWVARASPSQSHIWVCARALLLFGPRFCAPFWAETHQLNFSTASILFAKKSKGAPLLSYPVACSTFCKKSRHIEIEFHFLKLFFWTQWIAWWFSVFCTEDELNKLLKTKKKVR